MTLEQRVEILEKTVKLLTLGIAVNDGKVFINEAFIQDGAINAAQYRAADEDLIQEITNEVVSSELYSQLF